MRGAADGGRLHRENIRSVGGRGLAIVGVVAPLSHAATWRIPGVAQQIVGVIAWIAATVMGSLGWVTPVG